MIVRISTGRFDPAHHDEIARMLTASGDTLVPAIRALPGCLHYYAAIDRAACAMVNVSVWDTAEHASQMSTLAEMRALAATFAAEGVRFETIVNYATVWTIDG